MSFFKCCGSNNKQTYEVQKFENGQLKTQTVKDIKKLKEISANEAVVRVKKSQYDSLMKKYKGDKKFSDQTFPPNSKSLGNIQNVPSDCQWKRISEINPNAKLFVQGIEPTDVVQGSLGDCYFLSALAAIAQQDKRIHNVFGNQQYNPNGLYKVTLRIDGVIQQIVIDDYVPVNKSNRPLFCQPNKNQFWVVLLEKAWAKAHGNYANIASGTPTQVLKAVTYAPTQLKPIRDNEQDQQRLWEQILHHAHQNDPCCAGTRKDDSIDWQGLGLTPSHAYTLLNAATLVDEQGNGHNMIKLRNPWGHREWSGQGSQNDHSFWSRIQESQQKQKFLAKQNNGDDGVFYMTYQDFCHYFNQVHICNLLVSPKYENQKLYCDKKHGSIYKFIVPKTDDYFVELHQSGIRGQDKERLEQGLNRSTLFLAKGDSYEFIDGSLKYQEEDNPLKVRLDQGEYYIYAKIDPTINKQLVPQDMNISCYSNSFIDLVPQDKKKHPDFFKKVFLEYGKNHKRKQYDDGKMWISWKLFYEKGGFAYIAFGVDSTSNKKFVINFDQKDFNEANYILKKPYKSKGKQDFQVKPGNQQVIIARVKNGPLQMMKFPPPFDIQIDRA